MRERVLLMAAATTGRAQTTVRRILVLVILFALVVVAASGLAGLLERVLGASRTLASSDSSLALSLAFTFIGGPLAGLLWWWQRRRLDDPAERASIMWALYIAAMALVSLTIAVMSLGTAVTAGIDARWEPGSLATGVVWAGVWVWHRMLRTGEKTGPTRLVTVAPLLSAVFGLAVLVGGTVGALSAVLTEALAGVGTVLVSSMSWPLRLAESLVWVVLGGVVWWWHWRVERARTAPGPFASVVLVVMVGAAAAGTLFAIGTLLYVVLRLLFDSDPVVEILDPLRTALPVALVAGAVWLHLAEVMAQRSTSARRGARLVTSGVALIGAASGFGVVVNALLAALGEPLAGSDPRTLLLGGLAALIVGLPAWWILWRPDRAVDAGAAADTGRRVYLVAVFGASAVTAIITLLVIGYRIFEFVLSSQDVASLIERTRAPFGLLSATAIVFGYHFAIWRRDRAAAPAATRRPSVGRVVLVAGEGAEAAVDRIRERTGAAVTVWRAQTEQPVDDAALQTALDQLETLSAPRVLVVATAGAAQVIPLVD